MSVVSSRSVERSARDRVSEVRVVRVGSSMSMSRGSKVRSVGES